MINEAENPKYHEKRDTIYKLALSEFKKNGFEETSMRHLAKVSGVSLGSFYYYFSSKESIVERFYDESYSQVESSIELIKSQNKDFLSAFINLIEYRISSFSEQRELMVSLSRTATDPRSPLSPFKPGPNSLRNKTSNLIENFISHYKFPIENRLKPYMAELLWFYMMGIVLFWIFDSTDKQKKTNVLIHQLTPHILRMIRASALPFAKPINTPLVKILRQLYN